jgi:hypothetical protein
VRLEEELHLTTEVPGERASPKDGPGDEGAVVGDIYGVRQALGVARFEFPGVDGGFKQAADLCANGVRVPTGVLMELGIFQFELEEGEMPAELVGRDCDTVAATGDGGLEAVTFWSPAIVG